MAGDRQTLCKQLIERRMREWKQKRRHEEIVFEEVVWAF